MCGCQEDMRQRPTAASYDYGCLKIWQVSGQPAQYFWIEPGMDDRASRPPVPASADQMGQFLGLPAGQGNMDTMVNWLSRMGWQLVDVEIEPSRQVQNAWTPHRIHYYFVRPAQ
jgi:hypothetical protein